LHVKQVLYP